MQPQSETDYKELLTEVIKKQIVILGPDITLIKARNVPGLTVENDGTVTAISGEPQQITQALIDQFVQLSGLIVKKTMEPLLMYHGTADATKAPVIPVAPVMPLPIAAVTPAPTPVPQPQMPVAPTTPQTPAMPEGTQPVSSVSASVVPPVTPTVLPPTPASPEIDAETQQIINDALKQT